MENWFAYSFACSLSEGNSLFKYFLIPIIREEISLYTYPFTLYVFDALLNLKTDLSCNCIKLFIVTNVLAFKLKVSHADDIKLLIIIYAL